MSLPCCSGARCWRRAATLRFPRIPKFSKPTWEWKLGNGATEYLRVNDLHAFYGESHILHGMDFRVNRGEVVTLLGRNGAGRTTTLKSILGLVSRRTGSIMVNGRETCHWAPHRVARLGV